ncbi:MAG: YkvA family protein [Planctomycetota bacterium]
MDGLRDQIRAAFEREGSSGWLTISARMVLIERGVAGDELDERVERACGFVRRYVEAVPDVLDRVRAAADEQGAGAEVAGVVAAAKAYFDAPIDVIPDHNGVAGLVDDAYLALSLVDRFVGLLSGSAEDNTRAPEPAGALTAANVAIRAMIGDPLAGQLDAAVEGVLAMAEVRSAAATLAARGVRLHTVTMSLETADPETGGLVEPHGR